MRQIKKNIYFFVVLSVLLMIGCSEPTTSSEKNEKDTTSFVKTTDTPSMPAYDPAMDPLTSGPKFTKKLHDTLGVKMYEFTIKPGDSWALHSHPDHTVYVLNGGKMALFMQPPGRKDTLTFPTGTTLVSGPLTDSGKNVGNTTIKMLVTDIYRPRAN